MKKIFTFVLMSVIGISNATAQNDTIKIDHPNEVVITQSDNSLGVTVKGKKDDPDFQINRNLEVADTTQTVTTSTFNDNSGLSLNFGAVEKANTSQIVLEVKPALEAGFLVPLGKPSDMKTSFFKSYEARVNLMTFRVVPKTTRWWYTIDFGLSFSKIGLKSDRMFSDLGNGNFGVTGFPDGYSDGKSSLNVLGTDISLLAHKSIGKYSSIAFGLMFSNHSFTFGNYYASKYTDANGNEISNMTRVTPRKNNLALRLEYAPVRGWKFYMTYSPWSTFKSNCGPKYSTLEFGIGINY